MDLVGSLVGNLGKKGQTNFVLLARDSLPA